MSDHTSDEYQHGFAVGTRIAVDLEHILTDLIEHLRAWERTQRIDPVHNPDYLAWMADRAEARLREVQSE